jgi:hypothetical protein
MDIALQYNWTLAEDIREGRVTSTLNELLVNGVAGFAVGFGISQIPDNSLGPNTMGLGQIAISGIASRSSMIVRTIYNEVKYNLPPTSAAIKGESNDLAFLVGGVVGLGIGQIDKIVPAIQKYI